MQPKGNLSKVNLDLTVDERLVHRSVHRPVVTLPNGNSEFATALSG